MAKEREERTTNGGQNTNSQIIDSWIMINSFLRLHGTFRYDISNRCKIKAADERLRVRQMIDLFCFLRY